MKDQKSPANAGAVRALMEDTARLREMLTSPEVRKLVQMLSASGDGALKDAAQSAKEGDASQLEQMMRGLSSTEEGARLIAQIQSKLEK